MGTDTIGAAEGFSGVEVKLSSSAYLEETISGNPALRPPVGTSSETIQPAREGTAWQLELVFQPAVIMDMDSPPYYVAIATPCNNKGAHSVDLK
ncbi:hypothetical protein QTO34_016972 [Cnephaeus nilssonii]|uniref:Uncharacterized protein n=1 Tax=Cnephaeus nilssonii TaxID=3371016 RepID=A0AA40I3D5_CNENI|nr:hypothetical protein QTO34_016972 [Eptesicus nilssonii]